MRQAVDNGRVAVTFEWTSGVARAINRVPAPGEPDPPYEAVATIVRLSEETVKIVGLRGAISPGHVWLLAQLLRAEGFKTLYATRTDAHVVPMAEFLDAGDFAGHWRLDLETMRERRSGARRGS